MAIIEGLTRLKAKLEQLKKKGLEADKASVTVGFTQSYAVYVHENLEAQHEVGQAKFLEQPARELSNSGELSRIISTAVKRGKTIEEALLLAGLRVQREAQLKTPVDTGALKASAFTALTSQVEAAASEAYQRSQAIRQEKELAASRPKWLNQL